MFASAIIAALCIFDSTKFEIATRMYVIGDLKIPIGIVGIGCKSWGDKMLQVM